MAGNNKKQYIHPAEEKQQKHEEKRRRKKQRKHVILLLVLILIFVFLVWLFNYLGFGLGGGTGEGSGEESNQTASSQAAEESKEDESSEVEKKLVQLRISGSSYIYEDKLYNLDEFKAIASVMDKEAVVVQIADDNAVANSVESMHKMLDELGIKYVDIIYISSEAENQSASDSESEQALADMSSVSVLD